MKLTPNYYYSKMSKSNDGFEMAKTFIDLCSFYNSRNHCITQKLVDTVFTGNREPMTMATRLAMDTVLGQQIVHIKDR